MCAVLCVILKKNIKFFTLNVLNLIGRKAPLFDIDILTHAAIIKSIVETSKFLVIGGAGSIGQAVVKEIFKRNPLKLHVIDISENNMVELVRDIRSAYGYIRAILEHFP
jgi:FlaA1/EpsC-like NDP-sugar epimerase